MHPPKNITLDQFVKALIQTHGNMAEAAERLTVSRQHLFTLKKKFINQGHNIPSLILQSQTPKELFNPVELTYPQETLRVVVIGDHHDSPIVTDKSRITWIARRIAEVNPDLVIQIGDIADFDSVSTHAAPGTIEYATRPSITADMESLEEALSLYAKELPDGPPKRLTAGNHEDRLRRFENNNPEVNGGIYKQFEDLCAKYTWVTSFYGQWLFVNNVGFTHVPFNQMGREYAGKNPENQISNDAIFSVVYGHTHKGGYKSVPKIGPKKSIEVVNVGSSMPYGHVKKYAQRSTTGWSYGIWELSIRQGHVVGYNFTDMENLREKYSD
jgi:predicted MPP superfamily phosphohydrolase